MLSNRPDEEDDSFSRYMKEQQAEYNRLEAEKQRLFGEARERLAQARQAESGPSRNEAELRQPPQLEIFGRRMIIQPPDYFQHQLNLESGKPKTVYVWVMTPSGWAYGGPLTVFQSETRAELEALVAASFGGGPEEHIILEATDYQEASRLFDLLTRFDS